MAGSRMRFPDSRSVTCRGWTRYCPQDVRVRGPAIQTCKLVHTVFFALHDRMLNRPSALGAPIPGVPKCHAGVVVQHVPPMVYQGSHLATLHGPPSERDHPYQMYTTIPSLLKQLASRHFACNLPFWRRRLLTQDQRSNRASTTTGRWSDASDGTVKASSVFQPGEP